MQKVRSSNLKQDTRTPGDGPRGGYSYHPTGSPAISYPAARYCPPHRSRHAARYRAVLCAQPLHRRPPPLRRIGPGAGKYRIVAARSRRARRARGWGILVFAPDAPLNFTNAERICGKIKSAIAAKRPPVKLLVIEANGIIDIDYTGSQILRRAIAELRAMNIIVALARLSDERAQAQANRSGLIEAIGPDRVFLSRRLCASWVRAPWAPRSMIARRALATRCWSRFGQLREMAPGRRAVTARSPS
jgi:hypothetical protein